MGNISYTICNFLLYCSCRISNFSLWDQSWAHKALALTKALLNTAAIPNQFELTHGTPVTSWTFMNLPSCMLMNLGLWRKILFTFLNHSNKLYCHLLLFLAGKVNNIWEVIANHFWIFHAQENWAHLDTLMAQTAVTQCIK